MEETQNSLQSALRSAIMGENQRKKKVEPMMKKAVSLLLCCVMLVTLCVGCKKDALAPNTQLTDRIIADDLAANYAKYSFAHINSDGNPTISDVQVSQRTEENGVTKLAVTAQATTPYATIKVAADMEYTWEINYWRMSHMEVTNAVPTPIAAPNMTSLKQELSNYISVTGSALAVQDGKQQQIVFSPDKATWGIVWDAETKTAKLSVTATTTDVVFEGYYNLSFAATGWVFETKTQENDNNHPLLYLTKLNPVVTKK